MKRKIRNILAWVLAIVLITCGTVRRAKRRIEKNGYITGIYFHDPSRKLFEKSFRWLKKNGFNVISAETLINILQKKETAPEKAVWISLDDGWKDNITNVFPFAVDNKIPVTFFISTEPVENSGVFWWSLAEKYQNMLPEPFNKNIEQLWKIPESQRYTIIEQLREKAGSNIPREAMIVEDVKKLGSFSFITIGSHTINHVITPNCSDEELKYELGESKKKLEDWTGRTVNTFCYPNSDYSGKEEALLKQAGYQLAAIAQNAFITENTNLYKVPRFSIGEALFAEELCHMFGVWQRAVEKFK